MGPRFRWLVSVPRALFTVSPYVTEPGRAGQNIPRACEATDSPTTCSEFSEVGNIKHRSEERAPLCWFCGYYSKRAKKEEAR